MAKVLTVEERNRKYARMFIDKFNQLVKPLSSMCYIDFDGTCYLKSESTKIERFVSIDFGDPVKELAVGALYDTVELAEFRKSYRYSKSKVLFGSSVNPNDTTMIIRTPNPDDSEDEIDFQINTLCKNVYDDSEIELVRDRISREFYKTFNRMCDFHELRTNLQDESSYHSLSSDQIEDLINGDMIEINDTSMGKDIHAYITKEIFPNIKKDDEIRYCTLTERSEDDEQIAYMVFVEKIADYNGNGNDLRIFSLISVYQSI